MKKCKKCPSTDLATRSALCKIHHREYVREHYRNNRQSYIDKARKRNEVIGRLHREMIMDYLRNHQCIDCGNSDTEVLQFDHRDRADKVAEISRLTTGSTKRLLAEIAKCDIRCANCHIKRTRRQMGWWFNAVVDVETVHVTIEA